MRAGLAEGEASARGRADREFGGVCIRGRGDGEEHGLGHGFGTQEPAAVVLAALVGDDRALHVVSVRPG